MADTTTQASAITGIEYEGADFASLLDKEFKPKSDEAKSAVEQAVQTLAQQALSQTQLMSSDVMIAEIDKKLSQQVNAIVHHADFQRLESAWRGLHYLVNNTETDEMLKIRVMNISKSELGRTLKKFKGTAWDQSPIFKMIYEQNYGQLGGEPFGCLTGGLWLK
jgi:type VI secretion system protein ImpC